MNLQGLNNSRERGSTLVMVMLFGAILSFSVIYYLSLTEQQSHLSTRAQTWNMALSVAEAGIEEGLQHLNSNESNLFKDGWFENGSVYSRSNSLPDGSHYFVTLVMTNPAAPLLISRAFLDASVSAGMSQSEVTRAVRVTCSKSGLFNAALVTKRNIDLKGNGVLTDSYNSQDPDKSTNGRYDSSKYAGDHGDVATNGGIESSVGVQNANIYGKVHTGPDCPVSVGPNGGVGTHAWQAGNNGFQPGFVLQDANFTFPDTSMPDTSGFLPPLSGNVIVPNYNITTQATNTLFYPNPPPPSGVTTNITSTATVPFLPNPIPPGLTTNVGTITTPVWPGSVDSGVKTNNATVNNSPTLPDPVPPGTTTNTHYVKNAKDRPDEGTYVPGSLEQAGNKKWNYWAIDGYNYSTKTYTYTATTYSYPSYSYDFYISHTNVTYQTNYYDNILEANGQYVSPALNGKTLIKGPNIVLALPNGMTGNENIKFEDGASLLVHAGGSSISVTGNNVLNPNGYAGSFVVFCTPSVTSIKFAGNGEFTGVLVAPEADLELKGGGNSAQDFCGSIMVNSVRLNGHFKFHYDEGLGGMNGNGRWLITSWDEIL